MGRKRAGPGAAGLPDKPFGGSRLTSEGAVLLESGREGQTPGSPREQGHSPGWISDGNPPQVSLPGGPETWVPVTWAGLHEAGLATEPGGQASAPRQGRPQQVSALEGDAQPTAVAAAAPTRPGCQLTVHCKGTGAQDSEGARAGAGLSEVFPGQALTTVVLVRAVLTVGPQVTAPLRGQALPTTTAQLARGTEGSGGGQPRQGRGGHREGHSACCPQGEGKGAAT